MRRSASCVWKEEIVSGDVWPIEIGFTEEILNMERASSMAVMFLHLMCMFIFLPVSRSQHEGLRVLSSDIVPPHFQDISLQFHVTIMNNAWYPLSQLSVGSDKCCLQDDPSEGANDDCQTMVLMGDELFTLQPEETRNLTMIYPTMYVFDRAGECELTIRYTDFDQKSFSFKYTIKFNTSFTNTLWMPNALKGWLTGLQDCESVDQDRLRNCEPVNCVLKYRGLRNFYNTTTKRCEPTTSCISTPGKALPDKAYRRRWNSCKDLEAKLTEDDLKYLTGDLPALPYEDVDLMHVYQYVCVHGMEKPDHKGCICSPGWTSMPVDHSAYDPTTHMYSMCNVPDIGAMALLKHKGTRITNQLIVLGSSCAALLIVVVALGFYSCHDHRQQGNVPPLPPPDDGFQPRNTASNFSLMHDAFKPPRSPRKLDKDDPAAEYESARVHTPNMPMLEGELDLRIGDIITHLRRVSTQMWKGTCNGVRGIFPVSCAELYQKGQGPRPVQYN